VSDTRSEDRSAPAPGRNERVRRRRPGVEALEGRALLSLTIQTHPIPATPGLAVGAIVSSPDGDVWFTEGLLGIALLNPPPPTGEVGVLSPAGAVRTFPLPYASGVGSLAVTSDGDAWFVEQAGTLVPPPPHSFGIPYYAIKASLVRITPAGVMTSFPLPAALQDGGGPALAAGPGDALWAAGPGEIARVSAAGAVTAVGSAAADRFLSPVVGPDGDLWAGNGSEADPGIDRVSPAGVLTRFPLPALVNNTPVDLVDGPGGDVWFRSSAIQAVIGKITPDGATTLYPTPAGLSVSSLAASPTNADVWFTASAYPVLLRSNSLRLGRISADGVVALDPSQSPTVVDGGSLVFRPDGSLAYVESIDSNFGPETYTQAIAEGDFAPVTVTAATRVGTGRGAAREVTLRFSGPLDPTTVGDLADYTLEVVRPTRRGLVVVRTVAVRSASYDPAVGTVTLRAARPLSPRLRYQVTVNGREPTGLAGADGQRLAGLAGLPGTDSVVPVARTVRTRPHAH